MRRRTTLLDARSGRTIARGLLVASSAALLVATGLPSVAATARTAKATRTTTAATAPVPLPGSVGTVRVTTVTSPARTVLRDDRGVLVTFTRNARTVSMRGPARTWTEATLTAPVTEDAWVRELARPFGGTVDWTWLQRALADRSPDVLAVAMQYVSGAPDVVGSDGRRIAGDASYGPLSAAGTRTEGSDFNDYLGTSWTYGATTDAAEPTEVGALDCSGYVRMVLGYRSGVPLALTPDGVGLPRRSFELLADAPGVVLQADTGIRPALPATLTAGDLVFFDASTDDGTRIDHVGLYLGVDAAGAPRFLSSRKTVDGPTFADVGGRSTLSGTGLYATSFRAVRRV